MHQNIESGKKLILQTLVSVVVSFLVFFCLHFLSAWVLMRLHHFDRYWNLASWLIVAGLSVFHSVVYGKSFARSLTATLVFSFICVFLSFVFGGERVVFSSVFLRLLAFVVSSALFSMFIRFSAKNNKRKKKIRFRP